MFVCISLKFYSAIVCDWCLFVFIAVKFSSGIVFDWCLFAVLQNCDSSSALELCVTQVFDVYITLKFCS